MRVEVETLCLCLADCDSVDVTECEVKPIGTWMPDGRRTYAVEVEPDEIWATTVTVVARSPSEAAETAVVRTEVELIEGVRRAVGEVGS